MIKHLDGINKYIRHRMPFIHTKHDPFNQQSLSNDRVMDIFEDRSGNLWVGTWYGGLNRLDGKTKKITHFRHDRRDASSISGDLIYTICEDRNGDLWIGTGGGGLERFDIKRKTFFHYRHNPDNLGSICSDEIARVFIDSAGDLWIGSQDKGLDRYDRNRNTFSHFTNDPANSNSISSNRITSIIEDFSGVIWIGTEGAGLNCYDRETGIFSHLEYDKKDSTSLCHNEILSIYEDTGGNIWVGTFGGLNRFERETNTFIHYNVDDGLPNDVIYGILEDSQGFLWLSTNRGLSKFDPSKKIFKNFDQSDGLQSNEFNPAALKSHDGSLHFGGIRGITSFIPENILPSDFVPPMIFTSFRKYNEEVNLDTVISERSEIVLAHDTELFSLEFAALDYTNPRKNQYKYKLEGFNSDWIYAGNNRVAGFTHLDPGAYRLLVQGSNHDGVWNENGLSINIVIRPPFWLTWWFRLAVVLFLTGIILLGYKFRTRQFKRKNIELENHIIERTAQLQLTNKELEAFTSSVSHDLRAPLRSISSFSEVLLEDYSDRLDEAGKDYLDRIILASKKMKHLINDLLQLSRLSSGSLNVELVNLTQLAGHIIKDLKESDPDRSITVRIAPDLVAFGDPRMLNVLFTNLFENAWKFTRNRENAMIEFDEIGPKSARSLRSMNKSVFYVKDNGVGFDMAYKEKLFAPFQRLHRSEDFPGTGIGLATVQRIIHRHGGKIWAESVPEEQTAFYFEL